MIAPCGMNCALCMAHQREKNTCNGCWSADGYKAKSCSNCIIKNCVLLGKTESKFCFECSKFPCTRLKQLDKRYRLKYRMSMIENLNNIRLSGLEQFIQNEVLRWRCEICGGTICVHRAYCLTCLSPRND